MSGSPDTGPAPSEQDVHVTVAAASREGAAAHGDAYAWALAFLPLGLLALALLLAMAGVAAAVGEVAGLVAAAALVLADRRGLVASGRLSAGALPAVAWFLVPSVYLFKRSHRVGARQTVFWASIGCLAAVFVIWVAASLAVAALDADDEASLPGCAARASMDDVVSVFSDLPAVRAAGIRGVIVTKQMEVARGADASPKARLCRGLMEASDAEQYDVLYEFELVDGRVVVRVEVR